MAKPTDTDRDLLTELAKGRCTPSYLAGQTGYTRQTIQSRLSALVLADYVDKIDTGLYEITEKGGETLDE